jgi:transcriptional regulator with XRE-family HTH domain
MNPIKQVMEQAGVKQKEVGKRLNIKQSTLSARMIKEVKGSIEWSIEVAKELNVKKYTIVKDGYVVSVKIK